MKKIISIRKKSEDPLKREQFVRGSDGTVQTKILHMISDDPFGDFDFLIDERGNKYIQNVKELLGEVVNIIDNKYIAEIIEEDEGTLILVSQNEGALPQQHTVDQLNKVRKISKGTDIGDRISDMNKQGANVQYVRNPIDKGIESYQDFEKSRRNWNLKNIKSFKGKN